MDKQIKEYKAKVKKIVKANPSKFVYFETKEGFGYKAQRTTKDNDNG